MRVVWEAYPGSGQSGRARVQHGWDDGGGAEETERSVWRQITITSTHICGDWASMEGICGMRRSGRVHWDGQQTRKASLDGGQEQARTAPGRVSVTLRRHDENGRM